MSGLIDFSSKRDRNMGWKSFLIVVLLIGAGGFPRVPFLGRTSLWWDECHTVQMAISAAAASAGKVMQAVLHGFSSYFVLLAPWVTVDTPEWALRLPSALAGTLLVLIMLPLGREIGGKSAGLTLSLACAISPFLVWHSR